MIFWNGRNLFFIFYRKFGNNSELVHKLYSSFKVIPDESRKNGNDFKKNQHILIIHIYGFNFALIYVKRKIRNYAYSGGDKQQKYYEINLLPSHFPALTGNFQGIMQKTAEYFIQFLMFYAKKPWVSDSENFIRALSDFMLIIGKIYANFILQDHEF